ncbi:Zinc finger protein 646 [Amphibalanus amphitrite]|uniref:Zinc finger protein 646 n=1 Tax=Amphibalanus amphitrite TaxID=1232801 RepID=A0A6A4WXY6_AMPAM|nr:Zinc finger protein 646 [Amphibalanus amphitrite]
MFLFADQLEYDEPMQEKVQRMAQFLLLFYVVAWLRAPVAEDAPANDLNLYRAAEEAWTMDPSVLSALTPRTSSVASRRPVACRYCGKTYLHRQSLFNHVQMHLGKTRCTVCGETLSTVITLRNHMRTQHPLNDGEMTAAGEGSSSERQAMAAGGGPPSETQVVGSCAVISDGSDKCQS